MQNKFYQLKVSKPFQLPKLILSSTLKSYTPKKSKRNGLGCINKIENLSFRSQNEVCQFSGNEEFSMYAVQSQDIFYCITYIFLAVTNGVLALVTTTGNVLVLTAV